MKSREDFMTDDQKAKWKVAEQQAGGPLARTHENCLNILKVARPGKTAKDKFRSGH